MDTKQSTKMYVLCDLMTVKYAKIILNSSETEPFVVTCYFYDIFAAVGFELAKTIKSM